MGIEYVRGWTDAERHHGVGEFADKPKERPLLKNGLYDAKVFEARNHVTATGRKLYQIDFDVFEKTQARTRRRVIDFVIPDTFVFKTGAPNTSLISLLFEAGYTNNFPKDPGVFIGRDVTVYVEQQSWNGQTRNSIRTVHPQRKTL